MTHFRSISSFTKDEIQALFKAARTIIISHGLTIKVAPKKYPIGRILVVIPKKAGNAIKRNLLRRRLKAIFFENNLFMQPFDCIIFAAQEATELSFSALHELLTKTVHS